MFSRDTLALKEALRLNIEEVIGAENFIDFCPGIQQEKVECEQSRKLIFEAIVRYVFKQKIFCVIMQYML